MLDRIRNLQETGVLGLNARNRRYIMRYNDRRLYPKVDNKITTKQIALDYEMPVPDLYSVIRTQHDAARLNDSIADHTEFVVKPAAGSGGDGILIIKGRRKGGYVRSSGTLVSEGELAHHVSSILSGMYSLGGTTDEAMIEALVHCDERLEKLTFQGVPDIRIIVFKGFPVMAMTRLPTRMSDGKANLHQGAVGVGIRLVDGCTQGGVLGNSLIEEHPDTGELIAGFQLPAWDRMMHMAATCFDATDLGYLGVDIVIDQEHGPLILELNARPGLNIQLANKTGLAKRLESIEEEAPERLDAAGRASWAKDRWSRPH